MFDDILKNKKRIKKKTNLKNDTLTAEEIIYLLGTEFEMVYEEHLMKATTKEDYAKKLEGIVFDALIRGNYPFQSLFASPNKNP